MQQIARQTLPSHAQSGLCVCACFLFKSTRDDRITEIFTANQNRCRRLHLFVFSVALILCWNLNFSVATAAATEYRAQLNGCDTENVMEYYQ